MWTVLVGVGVIIGVIILSAVQTILVSIVRSLVVAYPFMLLWNYVIPQITGFSSVDFYQATAICILIISTTNEFNGFNKDK